MDDIASAAQFVAKVKATFLKANITITGHSLGGGFAQIVGQAAGLSSTVFNAPGGNKFIPLAELNLPGVVGPIQSINYRVAGDQVSLAGTPIGQQVTLTDPNPDTWAFAVKHHKMTNSVISDLHAKQVDREAPLSFVSLVGPVAKATAALNQPLGFDPFLVKTISQLFGFDPSGASTFSFDLQAGSPNLGTITLPTPDGVSHYAFAPKTAAGLGAI